MWAVADVGEPEGGGTSQVYGEWPAWDGAGKTLQTRGKAEQVAIGTHC